MIQLREKLWSRGRAKSWDELRMLCLLPGSSPAWIQEPQSEELLLGKSCRRLDWAARGGIVPSLHYACKWNYRICWKGPQGSPTSKDTKNEGIPSIPAVTGPCGWPGKCFQAVIWGPKCTSIQFRALCRKDSSVHIIFWEENHKLWPCLISFWGGFGINSSLLFLHSISIESSSCCHWGLVLGASGPETFGSQVGMANSHQAGPPERWRRDNSHRETSPLLRGQRRDGNSTPWQVPGSSPHSVPINNCTDPLQNPPCLSWCSRWRLCRFSVVVGKNSSERVPGNAAGSWQGGIVPGKELGGESPQAPWSPAPGQGKPSSVIAAGCRQKFPVLFSLFSPFFQGIRGFLLPHLDLSTKGRFGKAHQD